MQTIEVTISPKGEVQIHVVGAAGASCVALTKPLEDALGAQQIDREFSNEYAEEAIEQTNNQQINA